jgi:uncharacterized membrane protein YtjA (UPF0391 family)
MSMLSALLSFGKIEPSAIGTAPILFIVTLDLCDRNLVVVNHKPQYMDNQNRTTGLILQDLVRPRTLKQ